MKDWLQRGLLDNIDFDIIRGIINSVKYEHCPGVEHSITPEEYYELRAKRLVHEERAMVEKADKNYWEYEWYFDKCKAKYERRCKLKAEASSRESCKKPLANLSVRELMLHADFSNYAVIQEYAPRRWLRRPLLYLRRMEEAIRQRLRPGDLERANRAERIWTRRLELRKTRGKDRLNSTEVDRYRYSSYGKDPYGFDLGEYGSHPPVLVHVIRNGKKISTAVGFVRAKREQDNKFRPLKSLAEAERQIASGTRLSGGDRLAYLSHMKSEDIKGNGFKLGMRDDVMAIRSGKSKFDKILNLKDDYLLGELDCSPDDTIKLPEGIFVKSKDSGLIVPVSAKLFAES